MAALAISLLAPLGMSISTAAPASADMAWGYEETNVPDYFTVTGGAGNDWYDKRYPGRLLTANGDVTEEPFAQKWDDDWIYADYPTACNPTPGDANHYKAFWIYGSNEANLYDETLARQVIKGATSIFAASARERIGDGTNGSVRLNKAHTPRWKTTAPGGAGNCQPEVTVLQVPQEYLVSASGTGYWHPYRSGELESYLKAQGYIGDKDEKFVGLIQEWGSPDGHAGITGDSKGTDTRPGKENVHNSGGDSVYVDMEMPRNQTYPKNVYTDAAHALAHEMTHDLGASYGPKTNINSGGHALDCYDVLCDSTTDAGVFPVAACGASAFTYDEITRAKFSQRLDCRSDDYWSIGNAAPWTATYWNTYNNSFLWANSGKEQ